MDMIGAFLGWTAVLVQFVLMLANRQAEIGETVIRFFSFFTILTNTLVAAYFTARLTGGENFLTRPGSVTAITAFILIVGIVYQVVLRGIWSPTGLQRLVDELLHSVNPVYMLVYFSLFSGPEDHRFRPVWRWLLYPVIYFVWVIARGGISGFYPYPFVNVDELGYGATMLNFGLLTLFAVVLIAGLVAGGRWKDRPS